MRAIKDYPGTLKETMQVFGLTEGTLRSLRAK